MWACSLHVKDTSRAILIFAQKDCELQSGRIFSYSKGEDFFRKQIQDVPVVVKKVLSDKFFVFRDKYINQSHALKESQD